MTRTIKTVSLIIGLSLVCTACSDDDGQPDNNNNQNENQNENQNNNQNNNNVVVNPYTGPLSNLDSYYQLTEVDVLEGTSTQTITRTKALMELGGDSYQAMIRGYGDLAASSATAGDLALKWVVITDDTMSGEVAYRVDQFDDSVTWEQSDGRLVMTTGSDTMVYICEFDQGVLTLHYDDGDTRNTSLDPHPPTRVVLTQTTRPTSPLANAWKVVYTHTQVGIHEVEQFFTCLPGRPDGATVGSYNLRTAIDTWTHEGWYTEHSVDEAHDASDCSGTPPWTEVIDTWGFYEVDTSASELTAWAATSTVEEGHRLMIGLVYEYSFDATSLRLDLIEYNTNFISGDAADIIVLVEDN